MKIAIVVWDLSVSGGTQRQAIELANNLKDENDVTVYTYGFDPTRCYPDLVKDLKVKSVVTTVAKSTRPSEKSKLAQLWFDSYQQFHLSDKKIRELADIIDEEFDVLNLHDVFTERVAYYYRRRFPGVKTVWMSNDVPGIFQILDLKAANKRPPASLKERTVTGAQDSLFRREARRELRFVRPIDEVVVLDKRNQSQFRRHMNKDTRIIRSGLDLSKFVPKYEKNNKEFTVLGTGILFRLRRFEDLIDSVAILKEKGSKVALQIVGSDEFDAAYGKELREQAEKLDVTDQVRFLGRVTDDELRKLYQNADVFAFPNHNQTWGLAVFEAMASGTPVIVSKTAGAHEVLTDGENSLLIDSRQPDQIAAKIQQLLDDPDLRRRLAKNGRKFVEANISWPIYAKNMLKVFKDVSGK